MKDITAFLKRDYRRRVLKTSGNCMSFEELCDYARGTVKQTEKDGIERHLAECYHCLDTLMSINEGLGSPDKKRRPSLKKEEMFLVLAVLAFIASFIFRGYFLQFLTATLLFGLKWIIDSKSTKMLIMIHEAWKKGGDREAGKVLRGIDKKDSIDF